MTWLSYQNSMAFETVYFPEASVEHTNKVLETVKKYLSVDKTIEHVVVATTEGTVGEIFSKSLSDVRVIVVSHHTGFKQPNFNELDENKRMAIEKTGAKILTTTHAFAGVARGVRNALGTYSPTEIIAYAYRTFGQGTKVCAEIAMMAADAGLVPVDQNVICVAGSGRGADTAWIIKPTNTNKFIDLKMRICLCKPITF
ncbi:MAG: pyruvate kinase alpha/beta domain-containing protein [Candidatus Thorarchaeota archaeon]|nr:pyruvate kinase alpha/beta domain-containing protein [Candidatus Thorarchaeota archaeon]